MNVEKKRFQLYQSDALVFLMELRVNFQAT